MTKEQKKAIEKIKRQITIGECEKNIGIPVYISDLKTILSMLEEKDKEIEELKADNSHQWEERCKLTFELEKKEAIINEMAEQLAGLAIFDIEKDEPLILGDKEEVKEYFTKKVERGEINERRRKESC